MVDLTPLYLLVFYGVVKLWNRAGGWPEAWYRLRGIAYHQFYIIGKNAKVQRPIIKDSKIESHSPALFEYDSGNYILGNNKHRFLNPHGAPAYLYNFDDARPLPVMAEAPDEAGKLAKCDPVLIRAGYHNTNLEKLHGLNERSHTARNAGLFLLVLIGALAAVLGAYYSYNTTCAVHSIACVGVHP